MTRTNYEALLRKWAIGTRVIITGNESRGLVGEVINVISAPDAYKNWPAAEPMIEVEWDRPASHHDPARLYPGSIINDYLRPLNALELMAEV